MLLVNPPTYVSVTQMQGFANDFPLTSYTSQQISDKLCAASAAANAIMHRSLLAEERTIRYIGDGTDRLDLAKATILYVKRAQIVVPGPIGYSIPVNELLIDYENGDAFEYAPLYWAGAGYRSIFPAGAPIDITLAWGYGYTAAKAPLWSASDVPGGGMPAGTYNIAVTARTFWGETTAAVVQYATASGSFGVTITSGLGVYVYRVYASAATDNTTLTDACVQGAQTVVPGATAGMTLLSQWLLDTGALAEVVTVTGAPNGAVVPISATQFAHGVGAPMIPAPLAVVELPVSAFGGLPIVTDIQSLDPQNGLFPDPLPTSDTSAPPVPWEITEAVRLLCLSAFFEQNNLSNRGIYSIQSGERKTMWRSTEGMSGKGQPTLFAQAANLLNGYVYRGII